MAATIEEQIQELERGVEAIARSVCALDETLFLADFRRWSPRDVVAHLVGWNRYVIEGSRQILQGECPFYDLDPGEDYGKINALLVREIGITDRGLLLGELRDSARELSRFLSALDPGEWSRDHGVRHEDSVVTVQNTVDELIEDYFHHQKQIEDWARAKPV